MMSPKQRDFAIHYVQTGSAQKAMLAAGYSPAYAKCKQGVMLSNPTIQDEIQRLRIKSNQMADKSAVDVVNQFSKIAFSDRVSFLKPDPLRDGEFMYKSPDELTQVQRDVVENTKMYISEVLVEEETGSRTVFRQEYVYVFSDKAKALEQMGRHFGIFDDKLKIGLSQMNPFRDASPEQLEQLKSAWVTTMNKSLSPPVEGEFVEVKDGS